MDQLMWAYLFLVIAIYLLRILYLAFEPVRYAFWYVFGTGRRKKHSEVIGLVILCILLVLLNTWMLGKFVWSQFVVIIVMFALVILIFMSSRLRTEFGNILGEAGASRSTLRLLFGLLVASPLWIFVLLYHNPQIPPPIGKISIPKTLEFNIITVSGLLGGLVISAARGYSKNDAGYKELISVGQKFILATILLVLFAVTFFLSTMQGDVDINQVDLSLKGFAGGVSFWLMVMFYLGGIGLFSLAMVDLVIALRNIGTAARE